MQVSSPVFPALFSVALPAPPALAVGDPQDFHEGAIKMPQRL